VEAEAIQAAGDLTMTKFKVGDTVQHVSGEIGVIKDYFSPQDKDILWVKYKGCSGLIHEPSGDLILVKKKPVGLKKFPKEPKQIKCYELWYIKNRYHYINFSPDIGPFSSKKEAEMVFSHLKDYPFLRFKFKTKSYFNNLRTKVDALSWEIEKKISPKKIKCYSADSWFEFNLPTERPTYT
jgi:hypothetical protein